MLSNLRVKSVFLSFVLILTFGFGQEFSASMTATGGDSYYTMTFGFNPSATDGYDGDFDMYAPPAPPPPAFDAALGWGGDRYYTQILSGDGELSEHEYDVNFAYGSDNLITVTWDNAGWSDMMSSCILQDAFGGMMINVDMLSETSLTLDNPAFTGLKLKVTPTDYSPPSVPTVDITSPADGSTLGSGDFTVEYATTDFTIGGAGCDDCDGHVHVLVDGEANAYGDYMVYSEGPVSLSGVPNGDHSITIQLVDPSHQAFDPSIESTVSVTVSVDVDDAPIVGDIPDQSVASGESFDTFDLDDYLTELDGDDVAWSYEIEGQEPEPGFTATINAAGGDSNYDLNFGFHPDATDGYDTDFDMYAPPAPPPPAFDAALGWGGDRFYTQILAYDGDYSEHEYDINLAFGSDNLINLSWDNTGWSDLMSSCVLQDAFGGMMINVDMLANNSQVLDNPAFTGLKLKVTPLPEAMQTRGVMVDIDGDNVVTVSYDDGWMGSETVNFTATDQTDDMLSDSDDATFTVTEGDVNEAPMAGFSWSADNLTVTFTNSSTDADGDALSFGWDFGDGGTSSDENPTHTYESAGTYEVSLTASDGELNDIASESVTVTEEEPPSEDIEFTATMVGSGGTSEYSVTWGVHPGATDGYDTGVDMYAPPAPPPPSFDMAISWMGDRYYTQIVGSTTSEVEYGVSLQYADDNLINLSWDNSGWTSVMSSCVLEDAFGGSMINVDMLSENSLSLDNPAFTSLKLKFTPRAPVQGPTADFSGDPTSGYSPLTVLFTNLSTAGDTTISGYSWDFGDGGMSSEVSPTHTYENSGVYTVSLTVTDDNGIVSNQTADDYINVMEPVVITADFSGTPTVGMPPLFVEFSDMSVPSTGFELTSWAWDFGDGATSTDQNPSHTFEALGEYTVSLTVTDDSGSSTETKEDYINVVDIEPGDPDFALTLRADGPAFGYDLTFGFSPDATDGYDEMYDLYAPPPPPPPSFDAALMWGGDRYFTQVLNGSVDDLVEHEFSIALAYDTDNLIEFTWDNTNWDVLGSFALEDAFGGMMVSVDMTAENSLTLDNPALTSLVLKITPTGVSQPTADFSAENTSGYPPLTVSFTDESAAGSSDIVAWSWDFGDGGMSTDQNPTYSYESDGNYTVSLTITDVTGLMDTETKSDFVTVIPFSGPTAHFGADVTAGPPPLTVSFTDESTTDPGYDITSWAWDFGNGATSTEQNPTYTYEDQGFYTVSLTVTDENGISDELVMEGYITVIIEDLWPPANLSANAQQNESGVDVHLEWDAPQDPNNITINWDNGENNDGIGLTNGGDWMYSARWDPSDITGYDGYYLNSVHFFPRGAATSYTLRVWYGDNAGVLLYEQPVGDPVPEQWNEVVLDSPVEIDASGELWIGFALSQPAGEFPGGCDAGPAVPFYGDMLTLDGVTWESMSTSYGLNYNWNIQGMLSATNMGTGIGNDPIVLGNTTTSTEYSSTKDIPILTGHLGQPENALLVDLHTRDFQYYNVYRDGEAIATALDEEYDDLQVPDGVYEYYVTAQYDGGESVPTNTVTVTVYFDPNVVMVDMYILLDDFPGETTWDLRDDSGTILDSGGPYTGGDVSVGWPLTTGDYVWTIYDAFGDGICCAYGEGYYELSMFGEVFATGGQFTTEDVVPFNVPVLIFGTLEGTVTDGDGSPLSGVNIDLNGNSLGETGGDGSYSFEAPVGLHTVTASLMGYMDAEETGVEVFEDETTTVDLTLDAYPVVSVSGHVTGWDAPDGLSGAMVTLQGYADHSETTDASGNFSVASVYGGHTYTFRIQKEGYQSYNEQLEVGDTDIDVGTINLLEFTEPVWPPEGLQATVSQQTDVHLTWNPPVDPSAIELFYDDGTYENHWYVSSPPSSTNQLAVGFTYPEDCILNTGKFEMSFDPGATDFDWNVLGGNASAPDAYDVLASGTASLTGDPDGSWYFIDFGGIEIEADQWFYLSVQYRDGQTPGSDIYYCGGDATANDPYSWYTVDGNSWSNLLGVTDLMIRALISTEFANSIVLDPMPSTPNPEATIMRADGQPQLDEHVLAKITSIPTADPQITSPITRDLLGYNVYRDNEQIDFVVPTEAWDYDLADGTYTYFVTAQYDGGESEPSNSVTVTIAYVDVGVVIIDLDPTPTGEVVRDVLQDLYPGGVMVANSLNEYDLIGMDAVFVLLGIFSSNTVIDPASAEPLLDYIDSGGNLYMEGGDMWYYDPQFQGGYDFGPAFGITAVADGGADLSQVVGQGFLEGFEWSYSGENAWIDNLDPANGDAFTIFRNDQVGYNCGIAHDPGAYRTVGSSFEIAGLGGNSSLSDALQGIVDFFEIGEPPGFIEGTVTLNGGMGDVSDVMISTDDGDDTYADNDGSYSLSVQPGTYDVTAHLVGYGDDVETNVTVNSEQTVNIDFSLGAIPTVTVLGTVVEFGTETPLNGATVTLSGYADFGGVTMPTGVFNIPGVFSGQTYDVEVAYGALETYYTTIDVGDTDYNMGVITLSEFVYPPTDLSAQVVNFNDVVLNWHSPTGEGGGGDDGEFMMALLLDAFPGETTWDLNGPGGLVGSGGPYDTPDALVEYSAVLEPGDYTYTLYDSYGDGICCAYGEGYYELSLDGELFASGGEFADIESVSFTVGARNHVSSITTSYIDVDIDLQEKGDTPLAELYDITRETTEFIVSDFSTRDLLGYNVYRNGAMIEEVFADTLYVDNNVPNGSHTYGVRSVYTSGISDAITVDVIVDAPLVSDFEADPTDGFAPLNVQFTDLSMDFGTPIVAWFWNFGDGQTSNFQNPYHVYTSQGSYDVSLMVMDASGTSATETKYDYITVFSEPGEGEFIASISGTGTGITYDMSFGFAANATDGFDPGVDLYAPPAPPPPSFDVALGWMGDRYYTQILGVDVGVEKEYNILLQYPEDNMITLDWDNAGWSNLGTFILQDAFGGSMINVDMTQQESLVLDNNAFTTLKLLVTAGGGPPPGDTDDISLTSNWNLMSFDVDIQNNAPEDVYSGLMADGNLIYLTGFDEDGSEFFDPNGPDFLNTLTSIDAGFGYWVKVADAADLSASGTGIPGNFGIDIFSGWNLKGYWPDGNMAPEDAFSSLIDDDNLVFVTGFGEDGATFFDPNGPGVLNTLTALENGYGYWVKVNDDVNGFQYPAGNAFSARQVALNVNPDIIKTNRYMFMNGTVSFDHIDYFVGDKVSVSTEDGILVGEMEILDDGYLMTTAVYGDDNTTTAKDGAENGEQLVFTYGEFESQPVSIEFTADMELQKVDLVFQNLPEEFGLAQNFPNPFNPVTNIHFMLPEAADVQLVVYDLMGRKVRTLVTGSQTAGYKTVVWNSKDDAGIPVSAGMYIYELRSGSHSVIQKMVLLK